MSDTQVRALIVDDEAPLREILRISLTYFGIHVEAEASNGLDAVERYKQGGINVVIMDIQMPKLNGLDALTKIREHDPEAIVILVTASDDAAMRQEGIKRGARGFLRKPLKMDELNEDIRTHLRILFAKQQGVELTEDYYRYVVKRDFVPNGHGAAGPATGGTPAPSSVVSSPVPAAPGMKPAAASAPSPASIPGAARPAPAAGPAGPAGSAVAASDQGAVTASGHSPSAAANGNGAELVLAEQLRRAQQDIETLHRDLAEARARLSRVAHEVRQFAQKIAHETEGF